jgi:hypothetical protein
MFKAILLEVPNLELSYLAQDRWLEPLIMGSLLVKEGKCHSVFCFVSFVFIFLHTRGLQMEQAILFTQGQTIVHLPHQTHVSIL